MRDEWLGCWWEGLCVWLCSSEWGWVKKGEVHNCDTPKCYRHQLIRQDTSSDLSYSDNSKNLTTKHVPPSRSQYGTEKRIIKHWEDKQNTLFIILLHSICIFNQNHKRVLIFDVYCIESEQELHYWEFDWVIWCIHKTSSIVLLMDVK